MTGVLPVVRHMIVCEDVLADAANPHRITIVGLISSIRSLDYPPYPFHYRDWYNEAVIAEHPLLLR